MPPRRLALVLGWPVLLLACGAWAQDEAARVREYLAEALKAGRARTILPGPAGQSYPVKLVAVEKEELVLERDGGKMVLAWNQVKEYELYYLARGLLAAGDVENHLRVARLGLKLKAGAEMDKALEQLELDAPAEYSRIERVRAEIADEIFAAQPPKPAPAEKTQAAPGVPEIAGAAPTAPQPVARAAGTNHEGRALPPLPPIAKPVLYNTPEADALCAALQVFPVDNPWNMDISKFPLHAQSSQIVAQIGADRHIHMDRAMTFVLVPPNQPRIEITGLHYPGESDKGPYPIPDNTPIEGWSGAGKSLEDLQRNGQGDRHASVVDPVNRMLYEFYVMRKTDGGWTAACEATFDLKSNKLRPKGWTSTDAAGLPIFPSIVRYDECERGMVEHALRFTVRRSARSFIAPATHQAGRTDDPAVPPMGMRFRLKAAVALDGLPKHAKAVGLALKKYGMFVADNGSDWYINVGADSRLQDLEALHKLKGSDFEAVETGAPSSGR